MSKLPQDTTDIYSVPIVGKNDPLYVDRVWSAAAIIREYEKAWSLRDVMKIQQLNRYLQELPDKIASRRNNNEIDNTDKVGFERDTDIPFTSDNKHTYDNNQNDKEPKYLQGFSPLSINLEIDPLGVDIVRKANILLSTTFNNVYQVKKMIEYLILAKVLPDFSVNDDFDSPIFCAGVHYLLNLMWEAAIKINNEGTKNGYEKYSLMEISLMIEQEKEIETKARKFMERGDKLQCEMNNNEIKFIRLQTKGMKINAAIILYLLGAFAVDYKCDQLDGIYAREALDTVNNPNYDDSKEAIDELDKTMAEGNSTFPTTEEIKEKFNFLLRKDENNHNTQSKDDKMRKDDLSDIINDKDNEIEDLQQRLEKLTINNDKEKKVKEECNLLKQQNNKLQVKYQNEVNKLQNEIEKQKEEFNKQMEEMNKKQAQLLKSRMNQIIDDEKQQNNENKNELVHLVRMQTENQMEIITKQMEQQQKNQMDMMKSFQEAMVESNKEAQKLHSAMIQQNSDNIKLSKEQHSDIKMSKKKKEENTVLKTVFKDESKEAAINFRIEIIQKKEELLAKNLLDIEKYFKHITDSCLEGAAKDKWIATNGLYKTFDEFIKWFDVVFKLDHLQEEMREKLINYKIPIGARRLDYVPGLKLAYDKWKLSRKLAKRIIYENEINDAWLVRLLMKQIVIRDMKLYHKLMEIHQIARRAGLLRTIDGQVVDEIAVDLDELNDKIIDAERDLRDFENLDKDPTKTGIINYTSSRNNGGYGRGRGRGGSRGFRGFRGYGRGGLSNVNKNSLRYAIRNEPWNTNFNKNNGWTESKWKAMYGGPPPRTQYDINEKRKLRDANHVPGSTHSTCAIDGCGRVGHFAVDHDIMSNDIMKLRRYERFGYRARDEFYGNNRGRRGGYGRGNNNRRGNGNYRSNLIHNNDSNDTSTSNNINESSATKGNTNDNELNVE